MAKRDSAGQDHGEAIKERVRRWKEDQQERERRRRGAPLIWERIEDSAGRARPALTHDQIARAAVAIADADGLNAVTMRRLAEDLGVATMGLYRYVAGKDDVYELMIDTVHAEITLPPGDWRAVARGYARQARDAGLAHPWLTEILSRSPTVLTPSLMAIAEQVLVSLDGLGLDVDSMMAAFTTVIAFTRGAVAGESAQREALRRQGGSDEDDPRLTYQPWVQWMMDSGRYPTLTRYVIDGSNEDDEHWQFEIGLECVLDGIATRLSI